MFAGHPLDALAVAHDRGRELRAHAELVDAKPRTLTPALRGKR
jgi:hypothetical protein